MSNAIDKSKAETTLKKVRRLLCEHVSQELDSEFRRLHKIDCTSIRPATKADMRETLFWLREEQEATGHSFYCNRGVIQDSYNEGEAFVARAGGRCVGLLVDALHGPDIITVHPDYRRLGIGRRLLAYGIARRRGDKDVSVRCVTEPGVRLAIDAGFKFIEGDRFELKAA